MAEIIIPISKEERIAVAKSIEELNDIQHVRHMSRAMLLKLAGIKDTKLRHVLQAMIDAEEIIQFKLTETKKPRYYYVLTAIGKELLESQEK